MNLVELTEFLIKNIVNDPDMVSVKQIAEDDEILVLGLANDELGYVVPPNDFILHPTAPYLENGKDMHGRRHYEETNSMGPETAFVIAENVKAIMEAIKES